MGGGVVGTPVDISSQVSATSISPSTVTISNIVVKQSGNIVSLFFGIVNSVAVSAGSNIATFRFSGIPAVAIRATSIAYASEKICAVSIEEGTEPVVICRALSTFSANTGMNCSATYLAVSN